jgi:hypothetical protein
MSGNSNCERTINALKIISPDAFFMVDCYRLHDKYPITKNKEWWEFAMVDVAEVEKEIG